MRGEVGDEAGETHHEIVNRLPVTEENCLELLPQLLPRGLADTIVADAHQCDGVRGLLCACFDSECANQLLGHGTEDGFQLGLLMGSSAR